MIIRLTQKLGQKIGVVPSVALPHNSNPYADWTGHLFTVKRIQYILLTNTESLYSTAMFGRGITDDGLFLKLALSHLREFMADDGFEFLYRRLIAPTTGIIHFSKTGDRRLLGSINELVFQAKNYLEDDELSTFDVSQRINKTPMSLLKYQNPKEAFRSLHVAEPPSEE